MPRLQVSSLIIALVILLSLTAFNFLTEERVLASKQEFDRRNLYQFFEADSFDNDLVLDTLLIPTGSEGGRFIDLDLLGLQRSRLAYLARNGDEVVAVAVPARADDGFNGYVDLLVSVDMFGRIGAARVIEDIDSNELYGVVDVIESQWMKEFSGVAMRDVRRITWKEIEADNEYDQFVGASITPKTVADKIYDALVFFQSNRMLLIAGEG